MNRFVTNQGILGALRLRLLHLTLPVLAATLGCGGNLGAMESTRHTHTAGWSMAVPKGWDCSEIGEAFLLTRELAHGAGYPTLRVERIQATEAALPEGRRVPSEAVEGRYSVVPWQSRQGAGQTVHAELRGPGLRFEAEASLWQGSAAADRLLLNGEILPALGSVRPEGSGP